MKALLFWLFILLSFGVQSQSFRPLDAVSFAYRASDSTLSGQISGWFHTYGEIDSMTTSNHQADTLLFNMYYTACGLNPMFYAYDTTFALPRYISRDVGVIRVFALINDAPCTGSTSVDITDTFYFHLSPSVSINERTESYCEPSVVSNELILPCKSSRGEVLLYSLSGVSMPITCISENRFSISTLPRGMYVVKWKDEEEKERVVRFVR